MGHNIQAPLLQDEPTAPPLQARYPQIEAPGAPPAHVGPVVGIPTHHGAGPIAPPRGYPEPPVQAMIQHTCLLAPEDPYLTGISAFPRPHTCPACQSAGPTVVRRENGLCAWGSAIALFWVCCPLFWLPFCLDCDKDLVHRCSVCGTELARVKPCM